MISEIFVDGEFPKLYLPKISRYTVVSTYITTSTKQITLMNKMYIKLEFEKGSRDHNKNYGNK